jgi:hypothetical protein
MSKKNKKNIEPAPAPARRPVGPQIIYGRVPGTVPVARPASNIQLTPIVQPIAFVPYGTGAQPLLVMDDEYDR